MTNFINEITPPTPPVLTDEQKLQTTLSIISRSGIQHFNNQTDLITNLIQVWKNPLGLTPQQVVSALGTTAKQAFETSSAYVTCIETVNAINNVTTDPVLNELLTTISKSTITYNEDGSVTIK